MEKQKINRSTNHKFHTCNGMVDNDNISSTNTRHSVEIHEIITKMPSWMLRWGIMLFFFILLLIFGISALIRYPDIIKVPLKIESSGSSQVVNAALSGRISKIFVRTGEAVKKGQPLALVEGKNNTNNIDSLIATQNGKVAFVSIVQVGHFLKAGQEVFYINPLDEHFFGILEIPQNSINKVKLGQEVLLTLSNYPVEEFGQLKGSINYITDEPGKNGFFKAKISLNTKDLKKQIELKNWMTGFAAILTEDVSLLKRISKSVFKGL